MSDTSYGSTSGQPWQSSSPSAGPQDVVIQLQGIVQQLSNLVAAIKGRITFGTFTLSAGTTTIITQPAVQSNSQINLTPTNAAAAALNVFPSAIVAGTSFTITSTSPAAGTETFTYTVNTPT